MTKGNGHNMTAEALRKAMRILQEADAYRVCAICKEQNPDSIATMPMPVHNKCFEESVLKLEGLIDESLEALDDEEK